MSYVTQHVGLCQSKIRGSGNIQSGCNMLFCDKVQKLVYSKRGPSEEESRMNLDDVDGRCPHCREGVCGRDKGKGDNIKYDCSLLYNK